MIFVRDLNALTILMQKGFQCSHTKRASGTRKSSLAAQEGQKESPEHAFRGGWLLCPPRDLKSGWKGLLRIRMKSCCM